MGSDMDTRMGVTFDAWATPEEGEWPKRDAVPVISAQAEFYRIKNWQAPPIGQRPAEVTPEMRVVGWRAWQTGDAEDGATIDAIYRAMHAVAPVELVSPAESALIRARDEAREGAKIANDYADDWCAKYRAEQGETCRLSAELMAAHDKLATAENTGNHDYHGPAEEVPHPTIEGRTERRAVPDVAHEQFHRAVGDVLAGKIMPKAREQMRDALSRSSPDAPTTASTSRPMPGKALGVPADPRRLGIA